MKNLFTKIAVVILLTMPSCKDINLNLQDSKDRLDVLEGTTIATINEQITAINQSITDLQSMDESLDGYIKTLEATAADLQKQINDANAEIAKVESELGEEITALGQSLLNELNSAKEAIQAELSAINKTLEELKAADTALDKKIADLRTYVDTELASTKDWANATFSTLTQYEQTQTEISGIKASIEQINADMAALESRLNDKIAADIKTAIDALRIELNADHASRIESAVNNLTAAYTAAISSARSEITTAYTNAISNAIIESESGMKAWVNTKLTQGYYDIATIDGKLQALSARLDEADEELQKQIDQQKLALETAKSELTSAYKKAINDAIQTNNGIISAEIAEAVQKLEAKINSRLSTIESQITAMQKGIDEIIDDITTINEQITAINQSITDLQSMDESLEGYIKTIEATAADLQKQINDANAEIAKVESELGEEITALGQSLLNELNSAKEAIQAELSAINKTLDELKAADTALDKKIADLRTYVDTELASTKDWANATFTTLTQYEQTQTEISGIKASIEQINADMAALESRLNDKIAADIKTAIDALRIELNADHASRIESAVNNLTVAYTAAISSARSEITTAYTNAISNAIIESESGMKAWVNTKLTQGYYDIATIDGKLQALSTRLDEADEELQKQIDQQKLALETAKSELTSAYKKAINDAIQTNNGIISAEIAEAVQKLEAKINSRLSTIESQITAMQKGIDEIIDDIDTIQKQIESINTTLGTLENEDQELNSLIDKLESDYAALLQELEEISRADEISKKAIVDDIASLKSQVDTIINRLAKLENDFVNRIQSLKYIPEYSDRVALMSKLTKSVLVDFLVSPMSQAASLVSEWKKDNTILKAYLRYTKIPETRAVSQSVPLSISSVSSSEDGLLSLTLRENPSYPLSDDFLTGNSRAVIYLHISDGNTEILSDLVDVRIFDEEASSIVLSPYSDGKYQTANCYIVSAAGTYIFKAFKGNSQELAGTSHADHPAGDISNAVVLWETFGTDAVPATGDLIKSVTYSNEKIAFQTADTFKEGNAVIAAMDASGNILWSWHIWFTDQPQAQVYKNNAGTMMDRNLGATSATPDDVGALGLLYQWGRKDPFLGSSRIGGYTLAKSTITWPSAVSSNSSNGTIDYAIANPTTFIFYNSKNWDWYYTGDSSTDNTRWTTSDKGKSIYDPCPAGWRVPDGGSNGIWSKAGFGDTTFDSTNRGMFFSISSPSTTWYPASGYRSCGDGGLNGVGNIGYYWSASPSSLYAYSLYFGNDGNVDPSSNNRADGFSVRCLQESK